MKEGTSQYIGVILISIIVFILMQKNCQPELIESTTDTSTVIDSLLEDTNVETINEVDETVNTIVVNDNGDTVIINKNQLSFGAFYNNASGKSKIDVLESDLLKLTFDSKGAQLKQVELNDFKSFDKTDLLLIDNSQEINYTFQLKSGQTINTKDLYFDSKTEANKITFTAKVGNNQSLAFVYSITPGSYLVDYNIVLNNLDNVIEIPAEGLNLTWDFTALPQERDIAGEKRKSTAYWRIQGDNVDHLGIGKSKSENVENEIEWLSYKQQFFNITLINKEGFKNTDVETKIDNDDTLTIAAYSSSLNVPLTNGKSANMQMYFGPNDYRLLKQFDNKMNQIVELSADFFLFRWVKYINAGIIIPVFNFLEKYISSYGIIILILTLLIKMVLMPLTFKSYVSMAKTKLLKPELEALKAKFGDDNTGYSKAQMELYNSTGVSMFGGCLPMLLQMPFLLAMFYFFPSSIELRQEAFLWAQDLSTFDTVPFLTWAAEIPLLGHHLSVFTILMTLSSLLMAKFNPQMQSQPSQPGMEMMKYMPYIFPFFLLFLFNNFPAALTYYYFLSNMITFGQQIIINKFFIDEDKLMLQIEENKKKPKKKSGFAAKMEEIYKQQQLQQEKQKKK